MKKIDEKECSRKALENDYILPRCWQHQPIPVPFMMLLYRIHIEPLITAQVWTPFSINLTTSSGEDLFFAIYRCLCELDIACGKGLYNSNLSPKLWSYKNLNHSNFEVMFNNHEICVVARLDVEATFILWISQIIINSDHVITSQDIRLIFDSIVKCGKLHGKHRDLFTKDISTAQLVDIINFLYEEYEKWLVPNNFNYNNNQPSYQQSWKVATQLIDSYIPATEKWAGVYQNKPYITSNSLINYLDEYV